MRAVEVSGTGAAATLTLSAVSGQAYYIYNIIASYSGISLTSGRLTVKFDSDTVIDVDLSGQSLIIIPFPIHMDVANQELEIKLSGLASLKAKINIEYTLISV